MQQQQRWQQFEQRFVNEFLEQFQFGKFQCGDRLSRLGERAGGRKSAIHRVFGKPADFDVHLER
jgi:hypothetical protein